MNIMHPEDFVPAMDIIPLPEILDQRPEKFRLIGETRILTDVPNLWNADYLQKLLAPPTGFPFEIQPGTHIQKNCILLVLNPKLEKLGREGYRLEVLPDSISIESKGTAGVFYGIQTLRQLLPVEIEERDHMSSVDWWVPGVFIEDKPRFTWRGFMLDEGRYFHGKEIVFKTLDLMAMLKLNIFHWHLTEDQGWRIEIKKYPKLTEIGSRRAGTSKTMLGKKHNGIPHSGFYTQEEIKEIVAYARNRNITVIPEIEMPGHSLAALACYPELACGKGPFNVATHFGVFPDIYCAGKDEVFVFLQNVLGEILDLFPSPYIHIGGDETPKKRWKDCPYCQRRIREERLKGEHELQVYFTNRISAFLDSRGRRALGWNEVLQDGLVGSVVIQYWAGGRTRILDAIRKEKRSVVMSPYLSTYLDHSYSLMPLSVAYQFEPIPDALGGSETASILGLEFPLWSEWVPNQARLDYQVYPRLTAMAETGWTPKNRKNLVDFRRRLDTFLGRLDRLGVRYAPFKDAQPPKLAQWFGIFTIPFPQTRIA